LRIRNAAARHRLSSREIVTLSNREIEVNFFSKLNIHTFSISAAKVRNYLTYELPIGVRQSKNKNLRN
jgi:hypothetical protein